jgi:hypothetical protein
MDGLSSFLAIFLGILAADVSLSYFSYQLFPFQLYPQPRGVSEFRRGAKMESLSSFLRFFLGILAADDFLSCFSFSGSCAGGGW